MTAGCGAARDLRLEHVTKRFGSLRGRRRPVLTIPPGSFFALLGPSGLRQDDDAADGRRAGGADRGQHPASATTTSPTASRTSGRSTPCSRATRSSRTWTSSRTSRSGCAAAAPRTSSGQVERGARAGRARPTWPGASRPSSPAASSSGSRWPGRSSTGPQVLLLDEPLGALDLKLRRQMQIELKRIQTEVGLTFVHVTHDQEEAMTMADTIAVMNARPDRAARRPGRALRVAGDDVRRELPRPVQPARGRGVRHRRATTWCSTSSGQQGRDAGRPPGRPVTGTTCSSASGRRRSTCSAGGRRRPTAGTTCCPAASSPTPASPA